MTTFPPHLKAEIGARLLAFCDDLAAGRVKPGETRELFTGATVRALGAGRLEVTYRGQARAYELRPQ